MTDYFNHVGHWLGRTGSEIGTTMGTEEAGIYQSFSELPNFSNKFLKKIPPISNSFRNYCKQNHKSPKTVEKLQSNIIYT